MQIVSPADSEVVVEEAFITIVGRTRVDALVSVNESFVEPDLEGRFESTVELEEGPNIIEVVASVATGEEENLVLVVIYIP